MKPNLSKHFSSRKPSAIRVAQIEFERRTDKVIPINTAIGNVSLPMHPAMQERMYNLKSNGPFKDGVVKYSTTRGFSETNDAVLNVIASSGFDTGNLYSMITDGGSHAMELMIVGVCGDAGSEEKPLLLIDAAYTNYMTLAQRVGRRTISVSRHLEDNGKFTLPDLSEIEKIIEEHQPGAMVVIPYDNPTGHFYDHDTMVKLGKLCVKHNLWMVSDEAYRELFYVKQKTSSIWGLTDEEVPGIEERRVSIETASKVWNACGLRIGALVSDNEEFITQAVAENTSNLCPPVIDQYIFGALAHENHDDLNRWYKKQRSYYTEMMSSVSKELMDMNPGIIVSSPDASIYSVIDVRNMTENFNASDFVLFCAQQGKVNLEGRDYTLLVSPMAGFYSVTDGQENPGLRQMRIAYVETPENISKVPTLFTKLMGEYLQKEK